MRTEKQIKVFFTGYNQRVGEAGIHLYEPSERELFDAIQRARVQGFDTVWVHE